MGSLLSPGVQWRELDFSAYAANLASSVFAVVGGARKGPMNTPTVLESAGELISVFGAPIVTAFAHYAALSYFDVGKKVVFVRVGDGTEVKAAYTFKTAGAENVFKVEAKSEGTWGNSIEATLAAGSGAGKYNLTIKAPVDDAGTIDVVERFEDVVLTPATSEDYIEKVVNDGKRMGTPASAFVVIDVITGTLVPVVGANWLVGGLDGVSALDDADYIGTVTGQVRTGLQALANPEEIDINLVAVPGVSAPAVINELLSLCANKRRDCLAIIDPPFGLDIAGAVAWHNGSTPYTHGAFNSSYGAMYWPWCKITDPYNKQDVWVPPSGMAAQRMAYTDFNNEVWFAPAGYNRGRLLLPIQIEMSASPSERDTLYSGGNAINAIVKDPVEGFTIWGQRTLQRKPSHLDRVNVRRLLLFLEKTFATSVKYLVFEPNDPVTWSAFVNLVEPVLAYVKNGRGLGDYKVICDATTNTALLRDRKEMLGKVMLKPVGAAEFITIDFALFSSGAKFSV